MVVLHVALDSLRAEPPFIEGELLPGLEANDPVILHEKFDAALHSAETAMRLHHRIGFISTGVVLLGRKTQVRTELGDDFLRGGWESCHIKGSAEERAGLLPGFELSPGN